MNQEALSAWIALYLGVGIFAALCATGAVLQTAYELRSGTWRPALASRLDYTLALPRLWLRWQVNYLRGMPVILVGAGLFAHHLGFAVLGNV
ncbi:hypothetical protein [Novosphingobium sp. 9U]|uniref:hypothetical protein n=1 Tax=Novosphingobium sp. 9U TaxID=2653158 RepID=UPI0012F2ADA5|nr:hypothetical protein [Novosphingobium sp. 9U]VWX51031.1 Tetrathionate reductase subunit C [Novosphingobium sp. 9U]